MSDKHGPNCEQKIMGFQVKSMSHLIRRVLDKRFTDAKLEDLKGIQGPVLGYVFREGKERDVFQKDIEIEFGIQRSSATVLLQNLEQKGMILREPVNHDGRMKKIILTPKAVECNCKIADLVKDFNQELEEGITQEEKEIFFSVLNKMKNNLINASEERNEIK